MRISLVICGIAVMLLCVCSIAYAQDGPHLKHLWARWQANLSVDSSVERTEKFMERIAKAGYTGIVVVDNKFKRWDEVTPAQVAMRKRVRDRARELKLKFLVAVTATGYANGRLIVAGHHFKKDMPAESHVLAQMRETDLSDSDLYDNTAIIPAQGDFSSLSASPDAAIGTFSDMPDGCVAF